MKLGENWKKSFKCFFWRFPFDHHTPIGYLAAIFIQAMAALITVEILLCIMGYIVGVSFFILAFILDTKEELSKFNTKLIKTKDNRRRRVENVDLQKKLYEIMKFHFVAKELSVKGWIFKIIFIHCVFFIQICVRILAW